MSKEKKAAGKDSKKAHQSPNLTKQWQSTRMDPINRDTRICLLKVQNENTVKKKLIVSDILNTPDTRHHISHYHTTTPHQYAQHPHTTPSIIASPQYQTPTTVCIELPQLYMHPYLHHNPGKVS